MATSVVEFVVVVVTYAVVASELLTKITEVQIHVYAMVMYGNLICYITQK